MMDIASYGDIYVNIARSQPILLTDPPSGITSYRLK